MKRKSKLVGIILIIAVNDIELGLAAVQSNDNVKMANGFQKLNRCT